MNILEHIPFGRENAILRGELCRLASMSDRPLRRLIEEHRRTWRPIEPFICSDPHGKGYWLTNNINEVRQFRKTYGSYYKSYGMVAANLDKQFATLDGTGRVWVRGHYRRVRSADDVGA